MRAKINSVLEKKLEELESLLEVVTFNDDDSNVRKIQLGILFATTLLTAEISSRRRMDVEGKEDVGEMFKLRCMAKRLSEMEAFITNQLPGPVNDSSIEPKMGSLETNAGVNGETGAVDSLSESRLNESSKAEEEEEEEVEAEQWPLFQDASSEEMREVKFPAVATVKEELVDREVKEKRPLCFKALVCFSVIGLLGGMMSLVSYIGDSMVEDKFFLTPT